MNEPTKVKETKIEYIPDPTRIVRVACYRCNSTLKELPQGDTVQDHLLKSNTIYYCLNPQCSQFGLLTVGVLHEYKDGEIPGKVVEQKEGGE